MQHIPNIDIGRYLASDPGNRPSTTEMAELARACEDHGFFLLSGHGCDELIDAVFSESAAFFAEPKACKMAVYRDENNPLGYYDRELTKQKRDLKEVFDFKAGGHQSRNPTRQTRWPAQRADFQSTLTDFFQRFTELSEQTMAMIFTALGMAEAQVKQTMDDGFGELHSSAARLNYYPAQDPVPPGERGAINPLGDMALHHHTDPGAITLLLQDAHGGLQALSKTDGWIDVPPQAGTIVVNIGDVLQVWTNDRCTAGVHRVLPVHSASGRYSTPFFYQPRIDATVEPWVQAGDQAHYRPFSWREFIRGRVTDNFADYGADDVQIGRYRVA
jgi:isopenicillin N synthase-like dioxygenase